MVQKSTVCRFDFTGLIVVGVSSPLLLGNGEILLESPVCHHPVGVQIAEVELAAFLVSAAVGAPVITMESSGEGGPYGMALLAAYMKDAKEGMSLQDYLDQVVFAGQSGSSMDPEPADVAGFEAFMKRYMAGLAIEHAAVDALK